MKIAVLVPAYNLEGRIGELISQIIPFIPGEDILVVDDGSTDRTAAESRESGARVISHEENRGKGIALKTGFRHLAAEDYDGVITMDGDGQHDPGSIPDFREEAEKGGGELIVGTRMKNVGKMPWIRLMTNRTTSRVVSILAGVRIEDTQSGYRYHSTRLLRDIELVSEKYDTESEILIRAARKGYRISSVDIESIYHDEKSHINPVIDTLRFIRLIFKSFQWKD